jgi:hypothetical protein
VTASGFDVPGTILVGLASRDSLCFGGATNYEWGIYSPPEVRDHWDTIIARAAPHLKVQAAGAALKLAEAVITFGTGFALQTTQRYRSLLVHRVGGVWSITGFLVYDKGRRLFLVQLMPDGHLTDYFFQNQADPDGDCAPQVDAICRPGR